MFPRATVATDGVDDREWLQAADIVLAEHRTLWSAGRWVEVTRRSYPGCAVVLSRHRGGRWCLAGLGSAHALFVPRRRISRTDARWIAGVLYSAWVLGS